MNLKKILFLILTFLFLIPTTTFALSSDYQDKVYNILEEKVEEDKVNIYLFYGDGCPHCAKEEKFLDRIEEKYILLAKKGDKEARNLMHEAQCLAGMAFSNALLGIVHSMAHKTGAVFNIPHGCANAIYLPYVIQYNKTECLDRYAEIARRLNLEGNNDEELTDSLVKRIRELNIMLNIPLNLKDFGVTEDYFKENIDFISKNAILDACTGSNPRKIDKENMKRLFACVYYGIDVDF